MQRELPFRRALALAFSLATVVALSACGDGLGPNQGRVRLVLGSDASPAFNISAPDAAIAADGDHDDNDGEEHDRPSRWFSAANVTLSSVLVRNFDGVLVPLDLDVPVTVDIVQLEHGRRIELPPGVLPVGEYDQVVLVMTAVQGVMLDGTVVTVQPPGGGWTAIIPICTFDVAEGDTELVGLDLNVRSAFSRGDRFRFQPQFRASADCVDD